MFWQKNIFFIKFDLSFNPNTTQCITQNKYRKFFHNNNRLGGIFMDFCILSFVVMQNIDNFYIKQLFHTQYTHYHLKCDNSFNCGCQWTVKDMFVQRMRMILV